MSPEEQMIERRIVTNERLTRLEEHVRTNTEDVKEIKDMFKEHITHEEELIGKIHDELLANSVARKMLTKGAGIITMLGGFVMGVWKFMTEFGGTH